MRLYPFHGILYGIRLCKAVLNPSVNHGGTGMEEFFKAIEDKIGASGYPGQVSGEEIYNEICDDIEEKENGSYLFLSKKEDISVFEYKVDVMDDNFNLSYVHITSKSGTFHIDFDI